ncbi:dihydrofolate reductase [Tulasnella sp. JGI-2019a]|nr:dihydrofolate reductase [Tulasnella sp. JGI-2019a]KAG9009184.1 dihydrofolate reductase [Tulasnella sp. JGI-2019a]KAG9038184.1 dihydrofolate reductase [Tulasnella sp. JGI-2019a]
MSITVIVAATLTNGIGHSGSLPWRLPAEMAYFAKATSNAPDGAINALVLGRKTWESIPRKFRPLKNRVNVIVSRQAEYNLGMPPSDLVYTQPSLGSALESLKIRQQQPAGPQLQLHRTFLIGGASLYEESLKSKSSAIDRVLLTRILSPAYEECDVFFPALDVQWRRAPHSDLEAWVGFPVTEGVQEERGTTYEYQMWVR